MGDLKELKREVVGRIAVAISDPSLKNYLIGLFYPIGPAGHRVERKFKLPALMDASSAIKKLMATASQHRCEDGGLELRADDTEVAFTLDEANVIRELIDAIDEAPFSDAPIIAELREIFS